MDDFPHCHVVTPMAPQPADTPMFSPTYVQLQEGHDVLVVVAPGIAVAKSQLASGAKVVSIFLYALPDDRDPEQEAFGMGHILSVEHARTIAASLTRLCDEAEAEAATLATAAIDKARGR